MKSAIAILIFLLGYLTGISQKHFVRIVIDTSKSGHARAARDTAYIYSFINRISDIDFHAEQYRLEIWFLITYRDPKFQFDNQLQLSGAKKTEITTVWKGMVKGMNAVKLKASCVLAQDWCTTNYPFDEQELNFKLYNPVFANHELVFKPDQPSLHNDTIRLQNGWEIVNDSVIFTDEKVPLDIDSSHSVLNYRITIHRDNAVWIFFKLFVGMYVAFLVAFLAFFINVEHVEPRFGLPVGALFAAIANKYIVESILPETPQFTIVDWLHSITFFFIMVVIALSVVSLNLHSRLHNKKNLHSWTTRKMEALNSRGYFVLLAIYILLNIFFICWSRIH